MKCICGFQMVEVGRGQLVSYWCGGCKRNRFTCPCGGEVANTPTSDYLEFKCKDCGCETALYPHSKQVVLFPTR